jgi:S-DNA-T family DNA segregation ATPase FtsK/SpoIIIE
MTDMAKRNTKNNVSYGKQARGVLLLGIALLLFIAIASFDVNDPIQIAAGSPRVGTHNLLGPIGASLSYYLMQYTFGYPILFLPVMIFLFALSRIRNTPFPLFNRLRLILFGWTVIISILLAMPEAGATRGQMSEYYPSGLIGGLLASQMVIFLSEFGAWAVAILIALALLIVTIRIELDKIIDGVSALLMGVFNVLVGLFGNVGSKISGHFEKITRDDEEEETPDQTSVQTKPAAGTPPPLKTSGQPKITGAETAAVKKTPLPEADEDRPEINIGDQREPVLQKPLQPKNRAADDEKSGRAEASSQLSLDEILNALDTRQKTAQAANPSLMNPSADIGFEVREEAKDVELDYDELVKESIARYVFPSIDLLQEPPRDESTVTRDELKSNAELLESKLADFAVEAQVIRVTAGPVITLYELLPAPGVKVNSIVNLANDLALAMEARGIRIIAPIPGKAAVGIEIPNRQPQVVYLKSLIRSEKFGQSNFELPLALGKTINGESYIADLTKMPHLLIAGATGSGKSVGINTVIMSLLYSVNPGKVKFLMIDPKKLELSLYRALREHYLIWRPDLDEEVITKPSNAVSILNSMVMEMERRYDQLQAVGVRNIVEYNARLRESGGKFRDQKYPLLPYIVLIIDELADLMMVAAKEVETPIARLAQMARAIGLHLIVATQRPSVDVITGVIKANFPARLAYNVASKVDSRTVLDMNGAEQLLGNGDLLFLPPGQSKPVRLQNPFVSIDELDAVVNHIRRQSKLPYYSIPQPAASRGTEGMEAMGLESRDPLYEDARAIVVQHQQGSISFLQRRLKIGYSRAARLMDEMELEGVVGHADGSKPREVLITLQELQDLK